MRFSLSKKVLAIIRSKATAKSRTSSPSWFLLPYPKPPWTASKPAVVVPTCPLRSPIKSFSLLGTALIRPSKSSQNCHQPHTHQNFHRKYEVVYLAMKACNFSSTHSEQLTMTTKIRYEGKSVNCFHETMCVWFTWVEKLSSTKWGYASDIFFHCIPAFNIMLCHLTTTTKTKDTIEFERSFCTLVLHNISAYIYFQKGSAHLPHWATRSMQLDHSVDGRRSNHQVYHDVHGPK